MTVELIKRVLVENIIEIIKSIDSLSDSVD